jgi:hypothetical protein
MPGPLALLATTAAALFAGGALYAAVVEHPAREACGPPMAVAHFRKSYPRGAALQAPLALVGGLAAVGVWLTGGPAGWLWGGLLLAAAVPYTLVVMLATSRRLMDPALAPDVLETRRLLHRWGALHLVRTGLGLLALGLLLSAGR